MPESTPRQSVDVSILVEGESTLPTLVYLPGIHGDWTLTVPLREALSGKVRFVAFSYPRNKCHDLKALAEAILRTLNNTGIHEIWLLAESFGSQVLWPLLEMARESGKLRIRGAILAGGFGRHPIPPAVRMTCLAFHLTPVGLWHWQNVIFARIAQFRHGRNTLEKQSLNEFIHARKTEGDYEAMEHRLRLIMDNHPVKLMTTCPVPLYLLTGLWDVVVPWTLVLKEIKRHTHALRGIRIIPTAGHVVLLSASEKAARQITLWMGLP